MTDPLLSLDTLIVRPAVEIDGTRYEVLSPDELTVLETRRFGIWSRRLEELQTEEDDNPEFEELVTTIARKVLVDVPEEVFGKLTGTHKIAVVEVFTGLLLRGRMGVAGAIGAAMGDPRIGELFSPGYSGSTAGAHASGWRGRLWRWFSPSRG
jgi:hypothetical protein